MDKTKDELRHDAAVMLLFSIVAGAVLLTVAVGIFFGLGWAALTALVLTLVNAACSMRYYKRKIREAKEGE